MTMNVIGLVEVLAVACDYCDETAEDTLFELQLLGWRCGEDSHDTCCPDCTDMVRAECLCGEVAIGVAAELIAEGWSYEGLDACPSCMACPGHSWRPTSDPDVLTCANADCGVERRYRPIGATS